MKKILFLAFAVVIIASSCNKIEGKWVVENTNSESNNIDTIQDEFVVGCVFEEYDIADQLQDAESITFGKFNRCEIDATRCRWSLNSDKTKLSLKDGRSEMIFDIKKLTDKELELQHDDITIKCTKW